MEKLNPWDLVKQQLELTLSSESYQNWVHRTRFGLIEGRLLRVDVPDHQTRIWMETEYGDQIRSIIGGLGMGLDEVAYDVNARAPASVPAVFEREEQFETAITNLNPRFTFESFVVGSCNQFAHAAAQSVAVNPSRRYNPLFIYGGVGMGKTHLMHAIGRALMVNSRMRVIYTSSERFTNEVVSGIRTDRMPLLRQRYRSADVLLIDDIQLLGNKERTQDEFFHTFNELHDNQKQIVISSDSTPKDIPGLVERLRSRFEWGLMADIQPPDLETRMAILDKKSEAEGLKLPDDVRTFMATRTKSSVRELEGALVKLLAYASLTNTAINLSMAQQCLKHLLHVQDRRVTIDGIQKAVAEKIGIKQSLLKEKSNTKAVVFPRQIGMYLVKMLTSASLPEIGRAFGGKHHTTVIHSINKIEQDRQNDPDLNKLLNSLIDSLQ